MIVYLDNCMFNRPFDNQSNIRVRLETEAKLHIQGLIRDGQLSLVWSYVLTYENEQNPIVERRYAISKWHALAKKQINSNTKIRQYSEKLLAQGIKLKDAYHVACAVEAEAQYFLSTDDKLLKKMKGNQEIIGINPTVFVQEVLNYD